MGTYDKNDGSFFVKNGILILQPLHPNGQGGFKGTPTRFLPINWDDRRYLIPENQLLNFVNEINQGTEPRHGMFGQFYLRKGDENKTVSGFPHLPARWQEYLLLKPIQGEVIEVTKKFVVINVGKKNGLKMGMILTARNSQSMFTQLKIISLEDHTAKAKALYKKDDVRIGDIVSTKFVD